MTRRGGQKETAGVDYEEWATAARKKTLCNALRQNEETD